MSFVPGMTFGQSDWPIGQAWIRFDGAAFRLLHGTPLKEGTEKVPPPLVSGLFFVEKSMRLTFDEDAW